MFNMVEITEIKCSETVKMVGKKLLTNHNKSSNLKSQLNVLIIC